MPAVPERSTELWRKRLRLAAYPVQDAARYARVHVNTLYNWQKEQGVYVPALAARERGSALSYLQLIELRVVAAMRESGVPLKKIRLAREYLASRWKTDYPFAMEKLKTDGQHVIIDVDESEGTAMADKLIIADKGGQLSWKPILGDRLKEFEYEDDWVMRWQVGGKDSPVVIDPRIAFGSPMVHGIPTRVLRARHSAGESVDEIAEDFDLDPDLVRAAVHFELNLNNKNKLH